MSPVALENCNEIITNLYLGGLAAALQRQVLIDEGIRAVVCCVRELDFPSSDFHEGLEYYRVDVEDMSREPIELFWPEAAEFIHSFISQGERVFVHCRAGVSRSASTVIAYLVSYQGFSLYDAFTQARSRRAVVTPNMGFMERLCEFEKLKNGAEASISMEKYASWYCGEQKGAIPDVGSVSASAAQSDDNLCSIADASPKPSLARMKAAAHKVLVLTRSASLLSSSHNKEDIDLDLMPASAEQLFIKKRIDKIRTILLRHAADDPELGYCQGMHLVASLFSAAADSPGEAYWRFHAFMKHVRGLWLPGFPLLQAGAAQFEEVAKGTRWFQHLRGYQVEPSTYLPQAWLPLFTTWLSLETLAECLELLEGHGFPGVLAITLAILEHADEHLLRQESRSSILQAINGLGQEAPAPAALAQGIRTWLPKVQVVLAHPSNFGEVLLQCEREGSRVAGKVGTDAAIQWPSLPRWLAEAAATELPEEPSKTKSASSASLPPPCWCWIWCFGRGLTSKPAVQVLPPESPKPPRSPKRRASVKHAEQKLERWHANTLPSMRQRHELPVDRVDSTVRRRRRSSVVWSEKEE